MTTTDVVGEDLASQLDQDGVADLFATSACENESLPIPAADPHVTHALMEATQTDHSLAHIRSLADNKSGMYGWRDGIVHSFVDTNDVE